MAMLAGRTREWQRGRSFETDTAETLERLFREDDLAIIVGEFAKAHGCLSQAVQHLCKASVEAGKYGHEKPIDELIQELDDDFDFRMTQTLNKLKEGA